MSPSLCNKDSSLKSSNFSLALAVRLKTNSLYSYIALSFSYVDFQVAFISEGFAKVISNHLKRVRSEVFNVELRRGLCECGGGGALLPGAAASAVPPPTLSCSLFGSLLSPSVSAPRPDSSLASVVPPRSPCSNAVRVVYVLFVL